MLWLGKAHKVTDDTFNNVLNLQSRKMSHKKHENREPREMQFILSLRNRCISMRSIFGVSVAMPNRYVVIYARGERGA